MPIARIYGEGSSVSMSSNATNLGNGKIHFISDFGSKITNEFGADVLTRKFKVLTERAPDFEPQVGDVDFQYDNLIYWEHDVDFGPIWSEITVKFNGFRNGRQPRQYRTRYTSQYQEVLVGTGSEQVTVGYIAPGTVTTYASIDRPTDAEKIHGPPVDPCVLYSVTAGGVTRFVNNEKEARDWVNLFALKTKLARFPFDRDPEGSLWMCTENVQKTLVQNWFPEDVRFD